MTQKEFVGIGIVILLFIGSAFFSREFQDAIVRHLDFGVLGMAVYAGAGIAATVVAPVSTVALIPIASALWGPFQTALLSIVSWTVGSVIAFLIARRFGKPLLSRFINMNTLASYGRSFGEKNLFWNVVFLRMAVPVDVLSYAIGLFSSMRLGAYTAATLIGITPFAFLFSYASEASFRFQLFIGAVALLAVYAGYRKVRNIRTEKERKG